MPPQTEEAFTKTSVKEDTNENLNFSSKNNISKEKGNSNWPTLSQTDEWNCFDHILWPNVIWFTFLHFVAAYGLKLCFTDAQWSTIACAVVAYSLSLFGISAGVHRLWSHRSYKARWPLRIFLAFCNSMAYQNSIFQWARDHRVHHKYAETNADPVNFNRGFFFAHVGWLLCRKHPDVKYYGDKMDMRDVLADPVVYYQKKYYALSVILSCILIPTIVPYYFWGESLWNSFFVCVVLRYCVALNATWLVNSAAHFFGHRPYDKNISAVESYLLAPFILGEGFHNYHHAFPWDYSTSEWGWRLNLTTMALDIFAFLGLVYDRRKASPSVVKARTLRTGVSGHEVIKEHEY